MGGKSVQTTIEAPLSKTVVQVPVRPLLQSAPMAAAARDPGTRDVMPDALQATVNYFNAPTGKLTLTGMVTPTSPLCTPGITPGNSLNLEPNTPLPVMASLSNMRGRSPQPVLSPQAFRSAVPAVASLDSRLT